jgi:predicted porin
VAKYKPKISFWREKMKKQLLTTTALVAAGVLAVSGPALAGGHAAKASKPSLTLGGSTEQIFGIGDNSQAFEDATGNRVGWDQISDSEIHFNGAVTLDNGIKIKTRIELEGNSTGGGDTIDENWMRISGSFGELRMGSQDPASLAMTGGYLGSYSPGVGQSVGFDTGEWIQTPAGVATSNVNRTALSGDGENIQYYTPRFSGLQFGISYHPSAQEDTGARPLSSAADHEGISIGANWVGGVGGAKVAVAAGYMEIDESTPGRSDRDSYTIAGSVSMSGFKVNASWVETNSQETITTNVTAVPGVESLELGAQYAFGANAVSVTYMHADSTTTTPAGVGAGDSAEVTIVAYRRTLGPGVSFSLSGIFADFDNGAVGAAANTSNDGKALVSSVKVSF